MKKIKIIVAAIVAITAISLLIAIPGCRHTKADQEVIHLNGRIESTTVDLGPKVAGRVVAIHVRAGDRVKAGDLLLRLDLGETSIAVEREQAGVRSAEAHVDDLEAGSRNAEIAGAIAEVGDRRAVLELAAKESKRQTFLFENSVGTQREADYARTELERARAALKVSEERLALVRDGFRRDQTAVARADAERAAAMLKQSVIVAKESEIRAPADGVIVHRLAEPGQLIAAGQPAVTMAFADRLFVRTFIPEASLGKVKMGMPARVSVDAFPNRTFAARITEISPESEFTPKAVETRAERVNLVYAAKADLDRGWNEPLVPGQPAEVAVKP
ncbi:MAG TPA: efflux RND transporter periplasmic adaptor subunit [Thermoanaerobaculia bacterium]|jgi:HlyD family secretion protein|nr:efflux RND transporter periplasmic adaptor subunit [Thermoanaerobaculia bacterium]